MSQCGSDLVEESSREADTERGGDDGEASFGPSVQSEGTKTPQREDAHLRVLELTCPRLYRTNTPTETLYLLELTHSLH